MATNAQIAAALGVSPRRVSQLLPLGMPRDIEEAAKWKAHHVRGRVGRRPLVHDMGDTGVETKNWRERLDRARALAAELELARARGRLLDRDEVRAATAKLASILRAGFLALPTRMAPVLVNQGDPEKIFSVLTEAVEQILTALADGIEAGNGHG